MGSATASKQKPYVIIIKTGPTFKIADHIEFQANALSMQLSGEFWTDGPVRMDEKIGNFRIDCEPAGDDFVSKVRYMIHRIRQGVRVIRASDRPVVLISYDPLRSGMIALAIRALTGVKFICEVNGVYGDRKNLLDFGVGWRPELKFKIMKAVANFVFTRADGVRLLYKEQLEGLAKIPEDRIRCYFDAVLLDRFVDLGEEKKILSVGYPFLRKGIDVLIAAFEGLQDEFPDWELVLIGHTLTEKVAEHKHGVRKLTVLRGMTNDEVAKWIGRIGIFVLASRSEAMGRVLIETAAARKPRISTRVGGTYTVLHDGVDGIMVPPDDVAALQGALRRLMSSEALRKEVGDAGYKMAHDLFSPEAYCSAVTGFVDSVSQS